MNIEWIDSLEPLPCECFEHTVENYSDLLLLITDMPDTVQMDHQQETSSEPVTAPGRFDVVAGRGQGIQRLRGNEMYRELVSMNKRIYARCHKHDKRKVSKGIVDAIRELGGRFLECDEKSQTYYDIGDKKALSKTSQALREGQTIIRLQFYSDLAAGRPQTELEAELLGSLNAPLPAERYFEYSIRMLQSLNCA